VLDVEISYFQPRGTHKKAAFARNRVGEADLQLIMRTSWYETKKFCRWKIGGAVDFVTKTSFGAETCSRGKISVIFS